MVASKMLYCSWRSMYQDMAVKLKEDKLQDSRYLKAGTHIAHQHCSIPVFIILLQNFRLYVSEEGVKNCQDITHHQPKTARTSCINSQKLPGHHTSPAKNCQDITHHQPKTARTSRITSQKLPGHHTSPGKNAVIE